MNINKMNTSLTEAENIIFTISLYVEFLLFLFLIISSVIYAAVYKFKK